MSGRMIEFPADGRTASGYLALPPSGRGPAVVVIQEWWGLVDHIRDLADRFAREGFVALAPDLYFGRQASSPSDADKLMMALDIATAGQALRGAAAHLLARDEVTPQRVGAIGFCMGGQLALYAAIEHPDVIAAAVDFYGVHPKVAIDPTRLRVPLQAHFAERDRSVPPEAARALVERLVDAGAPVEAYFYDARHAFFNDQRPEVFDAEMAALAWLRTLDFLGRTLGRVQASA